MSGSAIDHVRNPRPRRSATLALLVCAAIVSACGSTHDATGTTAAVNLGVRFAQCMRTHGLPNVSDPKGSPPPPSSGNVIGRGGAFIALGPGVNGQSPASAEAAAACGFKLP